LAVVVLVVAGLGIGGRYWAAGLPHGMLPTGKTITPVLGGVNVGSFPVNMTASPDGHFALVTDTGFREQISVIDLTTGKLASKLEFNGGDKGLYFGIACHKGQDGVTHVAVSHGERDTISLYTLGDDGTLSPESTITLPKADNPLHIPWFVAGLAWSADGTKIYAVANQSHIFNKFKGSVFTIDAASHNVVSQETVGSFPLDIASTGSGVFVANEGGDGISQLGGSPIKTGTAPAYLTTDHAGKTLFVANSEGDSVSFVNLSSRHVDATVDFRTSEPSKQPGITPLGMAVSPDDKTLYVALADWNAIAVVDVPSATVKGYVPAGWYPTSMAISPDGSKLYVANAKGIQNANPNNHKVNNWGTYDENIIEGNVSAYDTSIIDSALTTSTKQVALNNGLSENALEPGPHIASRMGDPQGWRIGHGGIKHVFYIIKENRTYDQVLGDMPEGDGDSSLTMFGQDITPNEHALARRFALFDNFYVCAEVSADGWNWSTSGQANAYNERNVPYNYSGRGRAYDQEGTNNASPVSLLGQRDVAEAAGGYLWDAFIKANLSVRDYGMFNSDGEDTKGPDGKPVAEDNEPTKPNLLHRTCTDYRDFDMAFTDSDYWVKLGLPAFPKQMAEYGSHKDPSRFTTWKREFDGYVKNGNLPSLSLLRLPRDHTAGTSPGYSTAKSMVADNDYAVGEIVEAISNSPYWNSSAIFILEDDAQAGVDHIDCHRSPMLCISPFITQGTVDNSFYNTDSVLATMENIMDVRSHNQYLATAHLLKVFGPQAANLAPYQAIMPSKDILEQVNTEKSYRAKDSALLLNRFEEETAPDLELNDILWGDIMGSKTPRPETPGVRWSAR
jgi:DNA-binding beta-propeller fold protein YncE